MHPLEPRASQCINAREQKGLRVLSIAHSAVSRIAGRLRYEVLSARHPEIETHLVVPDRWFENGRWIEVDQPNERGFGVHISQVRWPRAGPIKWYAHHYPHFWSLAEKIRPDVIHLWEEPWSLVALHAVTLRNRFSPATPIVLEVDQNLLKRLPPPFEQIRSHVLRHVDFILARSPDAVTVVRRKGYTGPVAIIGYGVDHATFRPLNRPECRAEFGLKKFTIGYVGRLIVEKGLDDVLDALSKCPPSVSFAVLGEGPHKAELVSKAARLSLQSRVHFFPWGPPETVARFMNALDAVVLLTRTTDAVREQFGRVIIEAQSCGTPVIGSCSGAIPDVVGKGGWILPERDPAALAGLLNALTADPGLLEQAGFAGLQQVSDRFSFDNVADTLSHAWHSVADLRKTSNETCII